MSSGVTVDPSCLAVYQGLKIGNKDKVVYIMLKLSDDLQSIVVDKTSSDNNFDNFVAQLPQAEPRWAVYDFSFEKDDGGKRNRLVFLVWSPESSHIKHKMVYAASREALRKPLDGISIEIQATDLSEISYSIVHEKVSSRGN
ncbi:unnamed protein product [Rhizoctonia solani]|uniref:Cofilin n=1 Tax=Rhizoctonia solani TaxID=456999 RepID=A0A8H2X3P1_9AGAM|nr:unnamed protein product [Rhizoctonia solani]